MALREILASFGFAVDTRQLQAADAKVSGVAAKMGAALGLVAGKQVFDGIRNFASEMAATGDRIADTAARLGMGTDELQRLEWAAKVAGASVEDTATALRTLQVNAADAAAGTGSAGKVFRQLKIDVKNADGSIKGSTDLLLELSDALSKLPPGAERTGVAVDLLGRAGFKLGPMLAGGRDALVELLRSLDDLGGGVSEEAIAEINAFVLVQKKWDQALLSNKAKLANALFPALTVFLGFLTRTSVRFGEMIKGTNAGKAALLLLGAIAVKVGASLIAPFLPALIIFAALVLLVDDLITMFEGGDSVIGAFIDKLFGVGETEELVKSAKDKWGEFLDELERADGVGEKVEAGLAFVGQELHTFFTKDLPELAELTGLGEALSAQVKEIGNVLVFAFMDALSGGLLGVATNAFEIFRGEAATSAKSIAVDLAKRGSEIASDFMKGIVNGINAAAAAPVTAIGNVGKAVLAKLREVFRTGSPSKETHEMMADDVVEGGMGGGIDKGGPRVVARARALAEDLTVSLRPSVQPGPAVRAAAGASIHIEQRNTTQVQMHGASAPADAMRNAARQSYDDANERLVAALEPVLGGAL